jgi:hypothetical protein
MSIKRVFNGATIRKPGAYSAIKVENLSGFPLQATGVVGIIGEAVGGEPGVLDILERSQIQSAKARYKSGPIADALGLLVAPSADSRVQNGASTIIVYKTNAGTQATDSWVDNTGSTGVALIDVTSKNYGADENQINVVIAEGNTEDANAVITGTIDGPFASVDATTLLAIINGTTYTYTCGITGTQAATDLVDDLNTGARWSPSKPTVASLNSQKINLTLDGSVFDSGKLDRGYIKIDASSTLDTIVGLAGTNRGVKGSRFLTITKGTTIEDAEEEIGGESQISILYTGAAATCLLKILDVGTERKLTTTCAATAADDLDIVIGREDADGVMKPVLTIQEIVNLVSVGNYTASVTGDNPSLNGIELDYTWVYIENVAFDIKKDCQHLVDFLNDSSSLVDADRLTNVYGALELVSTADFLTGGTDGTSTHTTYSEALEALETVRCNIVVPLISADVGSLVVATINGLVKTHVIKMWSTAGKSERNAYVSILGSKTEFKTAAKAMASAYISICGQDPLVYSYSQAGNAYLDPWAQACIKAGMQAGSDVGEPTTYKIENVLGYRVRDASWDPKLDYEEMIQANCMLSEPLDGGGWRDVVGNTTYGVDDSFVWNRVSVIEAAGYVAYDLRYNLEAVFTGTKAKTGTANSISDFIKARMEIYLKADITVGDDLNNQLGYKNLSILIEGSSVSIDVSITPVQGIDFILPTIYLSDIRQTA